MIAGRRKVQKDGHMQIVCHTSGNLRPMNWVGVHFIFRLPLYIFILGAPHPFNPGSPRNDQPHRPNIGQTGIKSLYFLSLSKAPQTFPYWSWDTAIFSFSLDDDLQKLRFPVMTRPSGFVCNLEDLLRNFFYSLVARDKSILGDVKPIPWGTKVLYLLTPLPDTPNR